MSYQQETRIIRASTLSTDYAMVTLAKTAWFWLDDLVRDKFPKGGYNALIREFGKGAVGNDDISARLKSQAQSHCDNKMADLYNLANDNVPAAEHINLRKNTALPRQNADISARMPSVYRLFHFMPHATYLTTVWERRHFSREPTYRK